MSPNSRRKQSKTLVVQLADLGDLILAAPAVRRLAEDPESDLTLLTKPSNEDLAKALGVETMLADKHLYDDPSSLFRLDVVAQLFGFVWRLRRQHFGRIVLLHHLTTRFGALKFAALAILSGASVRSGIDNGRGWFLTDSKRDQGFGAANEEEYWNCLAGGAGLSELPRDEAAAATLLKTYRVTGSYAVLHPGSGEYSVARRWPAEYFRTLAKALHEERGLTSLVVGGEGERALARRVAPDADHIMDVSGQTDLATLVALLEGASVFVGNNAGVAQIAGALATPSVIIFGPTSPKTWHVASAHSRALSLDLPCSPCLYHHFELGTPGGCATRECLTMLTPEMVAEAALQLLGHLVAA